MKNLVKISPIILALFLFTSGCISINRNFKEVSSDLISKFDNDYHREIELSVGPFLINLASWVVKLNEEDEIAADLLRQVSNVQLGVYTITKDRGTKKRDIIGKINNEMDKRGWRYIVRSYSHDELTAVYVSKNPEMFFKKMFIITQDTKQLVLVEVEGKLDRLIELAIRDKKFEFDM